MRTKIRTPFPLREIIRIHIEDDCDVFGEGGFLEDRLDVIGKGAHESRF